MRIKLLSLVAVSFIAACSVAQGLTVNPGTMFKASAGVNVVVKNGSFINNGSGDLSNCNLYMTGSGAGNIGGTLSTTISNLYIDKAAAVTLLLHDLNVVNNVVFQNGLIDLNGHNLLLSPAGLLINETEANYITGALGGYVSITTDLNAPFGANPGNLGAIITSSKNLGQVLIQRGHRSQTNKGVGKSIRRYFNISPSNNSSLNAVFRFTYLDAELNGLTENTLNMWNSTNGGGKWTKVAVNGQNAALNFVDINVSTFSLYTLSSSSFSLTGEPGSIAALNNDASQANKMFSVTLTPNPVNLQGKVLINSNTACNCELAVFTVEGKKIMQQPLYLHTGINQASVNTGNLAAGLYYIVVDTKNGTKNKIAFTKQ